MADQHACSLNLIFRLWQIILRLTPRGLSLEKAAEAGAFLKRVRSLRSDDPSKVFKFSAGLPRDTHKARDEVKTLLDLLLDRARSAWRAAEGPPKDKLTALLRRTHWHVRFAVIKFLDSFSRSTARA